MNRFKVFALLSSTLVLGSCGQTPAPLTTTPTQAGSKSAGHTAADLGLPASSAAGRWFIELSDEPTALSAQSLSAQQESFRLAAQQAGIAYTEAQSYQTLFNGFSVEASSEDIGRLARLPEVKAVYPVLEIERPQWQQGSAEPQMFTADVMTGADIAQNELGLTGKGTKVGVIDTGIDNDHPAFAGRIITQHDFVGDRFGSPGYPFPEPDENADDCNGHGSHVAGIIGGNDPATDFKGVAPEVQFGSYRVFGCEGSTRSDIMLAAMERAAQDGMQVVNMSIGATYAWGDYPTSQAANRLVKRGIVVTVSAGNSGSEGQYSGGAPASAEKVISVAAVGNTQISLETLTYSVNGQVAGNIGYMRGNLSADPEVGKSFTAVLAEPYNGCSVDGESPFKKDQFTGKAVLIERGGCNFSEKVENANAAGAGAVVIVNNKDGYLTPGLGSTAFNIPVALISKGDGAKLKAEIDAGRTVTLAFNSSTERVRVANPEANLITDFSSYGSTPDLDLKPEIAAPGGNILSTVPLDKYPGGYTVMSGTSMAAPHMAGAAALLLQAYPRLSPEEVKTLFMNTSTRRFLDGEPDYVQRQGAGMVDIPAAYYSTVTATPPKLVLGASSRQPYSSKVVVLHNSGKQDEVFTVTHIPALTLGGTVLNPKPDSKHLATMRVNGQGVDATGSLQVTVPAGGSIELNVDITAPAGAQDEAQYGGYLVAQSGKQRLSVPYGGFSGNLQAVNIFGDVAVGKTTLPFPAFSDPLMGEIYLRGETPEILPDFSFIQTANAAKKVMLDAPQILVNFAYPAQDVRLEAVDAQGQAHLVADLPFVGRNKDNQSYETLTWDGKYEDGTEAPAGEYTLRLRALRPLGNPDIPEHWETYTSPKFTVMRETVKY